MLVGWHGEGMGTERERDPRSWVANVGAGAWWLERTPGLPQHPFIGSAWSALSWREGLGRGMRHQAPGAGSLSRWSVYVSLDCPGCPKTSKGIPARFGSARGLGRGRLNCYGGGRGCTRRPRSRECGVSVRASGAQSVEKAAQSIQEGHTLDSISNSLRMHSLAFRALLRLSMGSSVVAGGDCSRRRRPAQHRSSVAASREPAGLREILMIYGLVLSIWI